MNLLIGLAIALACSVASNVVQLEQVKSLQTKIGAARDQITQITATAKQCSDATQVLQDLATTRAKEAETARLEAQRLARLHRGRGDAILSAPPAKPGDDCGSAQVRLDSWWEQRK